ncbi:MAG: Lrp/AsnC family transcriptional regulator [Thermoleophilia bacterium]|nr:Lrp/AsnC family transcriptional regulator [Thermoleophilia bacterium]
MSTTEATPVRHTPDDVDQRLLNALQAGISFDRRPFLPIATAVGIDEDEVLARMRVLKDAKIIRQVSAIFDTRALGYESTLVAASYPDDRLFDAAAIINGHPGVSHNYRRTHDFNMWFTLAVEPGARLSLEDTLAILARETGATSMRILPTLTLYKINVQLDMTGVSGNVARAEPVAPPRRGDGKPPSDDDRAAILILQNDLPLVPAPFDVWADEAGIPVAALLTAARDLQDRTLMRRFAAVLNHRKAGFGANGMAVWRVPVDRVDEFGSRMATFTSVSHCYRRPVYDDWPYNLFTMVHARSKEACEETITALGEEVGLGADDYAVLYSTFEFKKIRLRYYSPDYREWEDLARAGSPLPTA